MELPGNSRSEISSACLSVPSGRQTGTQAGQAQSLSAADLRLDSAQNRSFFKRLDVKQAGRPISEVVSDGGTGCGGEGGIRTHVPRSSRDKSISSRPRYDHFGTSPHYPDRTRLRLERKNSCIRARHSFSRIPETTSILWLSLPSPARS